MSVNEVSGVNFKANDFKVKEIRKTKHQPKLISVEQFPDYEVKTYKTKGSRYEKWEAGLASTFIPGMGHAINGQWGKAILFNVGSLGATIAAGVLALQKTANPVIAAVAGGATYLLSRIFDITNAVKSAKSYQKVITPKESAIENKRLDMTA